MPRVSFHLLSSPPLSFPLLSSPLCFSPETVKRRREEGSQPGIFQMLALWFACVRRFISVCMHVLFSPRGGIGWRCVCVCVCAQCVCALCVLVLFVVWCGCGGCAFCVGGLFFCVPLDRSVCVCV